MGASLDGSYKGSIERLWLADAAATTELGRRLARELAGSAAGGEAGQFARGRSGPWNATTTGAGSNQGTGALHGTGEGAGATRATAAQASEGPPFGRPPSDPFQPPILLLSGGLGAGKTCLVQGLAAELGITDAITSPTFALAQHYQGSWSRQLPSEAAPPLGALAPGATASRPPALVHIDLYRLEQPAAADDLFAQEEEEAAALGALLAVEWPERLGLWPQGAWQVELLLKGEGRLALIRRPPEWSAD